jgi:hypothetical protein
MKKKKKKEEYSVLRVPMYSMGDSTSGLSLSAFFFVPLQTSGQVRQLKGLVAGEN